ncbi:MAG TPA: hypothetical protein VGL61_00560 [Kofleriaceae bacterium]
MSTPVPYRQWALTIGVIVAAARAAGADAPVASSKEPAKPGPAEPPPEPAPVPQNPSHDAEATAVAPLPGEESGRVDPGEPGDSVGRKTARVVLFIPKVLFEIALAPIEGAAYVEDKYQFEDWYYRMFYYRDRTIGILPTATYVTGLGFTAGAKFIDTDTYGGHEHTVLQATTGGQFRVGLLASADTGNRLGPVRLEVEGNFDRRPTEPFFGIGNEGHLSAPTVSNINAFTDPTAVETYFRYQEARAAAQADFAVISHLHMFLKGSFTQLEYTHDTHEFPSIDEIYDPASLVGFGTKMNRAYGELEARWDTRAATTKWEPSTVHGSGSLVDAYGGLSHATDGDSRFWHYGFDLQQYVHLGFGPRVLVLSAHGEAVTGPLDQVPLTELPMLGGAWYLRGYDYARFRDRVALEASAQYMWSLTGNTSAFVFTDVGRVYDAWNDFTVDDLHAGFGVGLDVYMPPNFVADLAIATSTDGGIALIAEFTPLLDSRPRWR